MRIVTIKGKTLENIQSLGYINRNMKLREDS